MKNSRSLWLAACALSLLLFDARAMAFHQARGGNGTGPFLFWKQMPVAYSIQSRCALADEPNALNAAVLAAGEDEATFNQLCHAAIQRAFASWTVPSCTSLRLNELPDTPVKEVGYDKNSSNNLNTVQFMTNLCGQVVDLSDPCFADGTCDGKYSCFGPDLSVVALTSTFYDSNDGHLLDADVEANAATYEFSAEAGDPLPGSIDVQNTFTHEAGHFIGMAHSCDSVANCSSDLFDTTMFFQENSPGETTKRTLKQDDINGLCTIYPLGSGAGGGCATSGEGGLFVPFLLVLGGLSWQAGRSRRRAARFTYPGAKVKIPLR